MIATPSEPPSDVSAHPPVPSGGQGCTAPWIHRSLFALVVVVAWLLLPISVWAHGGAFPGPASGPLGSGPSSGGAEGPQSDPASWSHWWSLNRLSYLDLGADRRLLLGLGPSTGPRGDTVWDGRPSAELLARTAVPALLASLESRDVPRRTAGMIALAKLGQAPVDIMTEGEEPVRLVEVFAQRLADPHQEVHETAALALGILGDPSSADLLAALLEDRPDGRRQCERGSVPVRTRAFAAYGLTLLAARCPHESVRRFAVHHLAKALEDRETSVDVSVACALGLGRIPLRHGPLEADPEGSSTTRPTPSRQNQVRFLHERLDPRAQPRVDARVLAQLGLSSVLLAPDPDRLPKLLELLGAQVPRSQALQVGAIAAIGPLAEGALGWGDELGQLVIDESRAQKRATRGLSSISLARWAAAHPDPERTSMARKELLRRLARGRSHERPWAALGLGLLGRAIGLNGEHLDGSTDVALRAHLLGTKNPSERGAYAIALGLRRDRASTDVLLELLRKGQDAIRGYAGLSLAMIHGHQAPKDVRIALHAGLNASGNRPGLMRELALAGCLLKDPEFCPALVATLGQRESRLEKVSFVMGLSWLGDLRCVEALTALVVDEQEEDMVRAFAAVALGSVGDREALPWSHLLARDVSWLEAPPTLMDPLGASGVLDLF